MKYEIIADSGCDLKNLEQIGENQITFCRAPLTLAVGEREFVDNNWLDVSEFMREMEEYQGRTGSAAPSPQEWYHAYEQAQEVFAVTITGTLSGSYKSAMAARDMILETEPQKKIHVFDSKSAGPGMTLLVKKIQECIQNGMEFDEIVAYIEQYQKQTHLLFVLESLDNFVKNGRVSKLVGGMAGLLGIKILGCASEEGTLEVLQKCRGKRSAYEKLVEEMIKKGFHGSKVIISQCFNEERADDISALIKNIFPHCDITIMPTSGLCSYYAERGGILLAFEA